VDHNDSHNTGGKVSQTVSFVVQRIGGYQVKSTVIGDRDVFCNKPLLTRLDRSRIFTNTGDGLKTHLHQGVWNINTSNTRTLNSRLVCHPDNLV
jgi:hypothetical protein